MIKNEESQEVDLEAWYKQHKELKFVPNPNRYIKALEKALFEGGFRMTSNQSFKEWMYPANDYEVTPATDVDGRIGDLHDYIEKKMREAYVAGFKQGYIGRVNKATNND